MSESSTWCPKSDLYDALQDARSEERYENGQVDPEPGPRESPDYWNGAEEND